MVEVDREAVEEAKRVAEQLFLEKISAISAEKNNPIAKEVLRTPKSHQKLFYRVFFDKISKADSIKAKCLDCCVFDKAEITNCTVKTCPLWRVRPYQPKDKKNE